MTPSGTSAKNSAGAISVMSGFARPQSALQLSHDLLALRLLIG
ncbi:hypothetical protein ACO0LL_23275 [Undibacterium sp. TC4M20W]